MSSKLGMHDTKIRPRTQSAKVGLRRGQNGASSKSSLRFLDLSFEGQRPSTAGTQQAVLNNGFRPHGGYRGIKKFPLSPYTEISQSVNQLDQFDDRESEREFCRTISPAWTMDVYKEEYHSSQSPLFVHKLLSPSRLSQKFDPGNIPQSLFTSNKKIPKKQYYRPNRTHQYLSATELRDCAKEEVNIKLGRPTRTTLLRARQRCSSAPINAYEARRDMIKKFEERYESRKSSTSSQTKDAFGGYVPTGESMHSYLTGARYNRAHCLDAKSLQEHGVYMPRDNPLACFILKRGSTSICSQMQNKDEASPTSPACVVDEEDSESFPFPSSPVHKVSPTLSADPSHHLAPPLVPPQPPSSPHPRAWEDQTQVQVDIGPGVAKQEIGQEEEAEDKFLHQPVLETILDMDDALNVKGSGVGRPDRAKSGKNSHGSRGVTFPIRPQSASAHMLPSVVVQGTALSLPGRSPLGHPNAPAQPSQPKPSTTAPPSSLQDNGPEILDTPDVKHEIKMEDKAVNVPSILSEFTVGDTCAASDKERKDEENSEVKATDTEEDGGTGKSDGTNSEFADTKESQVERPSTAKSKKVRFAESTNEGENNQTEDTVSTKDGELEEVPIRNETPKLPEENVVFFLTEDKDKKTKAQLNSPNTPCTNRDGCNDGTGSDNLLPEEHKVDSPLQNDTSKDCGQGDGPIINTDENIKDAPTDVAETH